MTVSVWVVPGATTLHVTPLPANSFATVFESPIRPALLAA